MDADHSSYAARLTLDGFVDEVPWEMGAVMGKPAAVAHKCCLLSLDTMHAQVLVSILFRSGLCACQFMTVVSFSLSHWTLPWQCEQDYGRAVR